MADMLIQPDELRKAAAEFIHAGRDTTDILKRLDDTTSELEKQWAGATQQVFFKQYRDLRGYMEGFSALMENISREMNAMAERFEEEDRKG